MKFVVKALVLMAFIKMLPGSSTAVQAASPANILVSPVGAICPNQLESSIDRIIQQPSYRTAKWGIHIESIDYQGVFYSRNANDFLIPASNMKLFTTAAALQAISNDVKRKWRGFDAEIKTVNQESDNNDADDVLSRIGGVRKVQNNLSYLGISPQSFNQVDGSGLSRSNLTTPTTLVTLLKSMRNTAEAEQFYQSLPIAGVSGTLENRFLNTSVQGRVRAKTGTLTGVRALSGYLNHQIYGTIVFSILVNQSDRGDSLRKGIDEIVTTLGNLYPCS